MMKADSTAKNEKMATHIDGKNDGKKAEIHVIETHIHTILGFQVYNMLAFMQHQTSQKQNISLKT